MHRASVARFVRIGRDTPAERATSRSDAVGCRCASLLPGRVGAACCVRGLRARDNPAAPGAGRPRRQGLAITRPFHRIDTCATRNARRGVKSWRCCVTDRCSPARVDMQCRLPLLVEGVRGVSDRTVKRLLAPRSDTGAGRSTWRLARLSPVGEDQTVGVMTARDPGIRLQPVSRYALVVDLLALDHRSTAALTTASQSARIGTPPRTGPHAPGPSKTKQR